MQQMYTYGCDVFAAFSGFTLHGQDVLMQPFQTFTLCGQNVLMQPFQALYCMDKMYYAAFSDFYIVWTRCTIYAAFSGSILLCTGIRRTCSPFRLAITYTTVLYCLDFDLRSSCFLQLWQAADVASTRNSRFIGLEELLFLIRKDKVRHYLLSSFEKGF